MNALHRLAFRIRALCIDILRANRAIRELEDEQRASMARSMVKHGTRTPVPEFLRRGRP